MNLPLDHSRGLESQIAHAPRNEAGMPLGGIGAGKIEFCRGGRFTNATINNNCDSPITDGLARVPLFPRILEGADFSVLENSIRRKSINAPEGIPGAWMAVHTPEDGARLLKTVGRQSFTAVGAEQIEFDARFPVAAVTYKGFAGVDLSLEAYSSMELIDTDPQYKNSSLPLALFAFRITRGGKNAGPVTLAFSWQNLNGIGGYPLTLINEPDPTTPEFRNQSGPAGIWFGHHPQNSSDRRVLGDYSLRVWSDGAKAEISHCTGWNPAGEGREVWEPFARSGKFDGKAGDSSAGALAATVNLAPGESATIVFALAWHMPHLLAAETRWDHLVRPSSAPPPPVSLNRPDYGHIYANWFKNSWDIAGYGLENWKKIRDGVEGWQSALSGSSLPALAVAGLCNDLCALVSNTWYTKDGHYAVNEAPTDMNGCFGTIDQRSVGNAAVACAFPGLNRAELSLFARDQVRSGDDPRRHGTHWNANGGAFDLPIDRAGAILHDIGFDHLEGGRLGDIAWPSSHWPEHTSHFVLQSYQYALWSGDAKWLDSVYPRFKAALEFQARLDQDGDGAPDHWGHGSCTYDTELYPYYGATAYTTGLFLAALKVCRLLANERGDVDFVQWTDARFAAAQHVLENELWDEEKGYYICWRDRNHLSWKGPRKHAAKSTNIHISQLAGAWWADMLGVGDIVAPQRRLRALEFIGRHNVEMVPGCSADEVRLDGHYMQSMSALAMGNYAAQAVMAGLPDFGWMSMERIYRARYENDGCPWDACLQWSGPGNLQPQWGRWYMSHPASWYVLMGFGGLWIDQLRGRLRLRPNWPKAWGDELKAMPVFLPGLWGEVNATRSGGSWSASLQIKRLLRPLKINDIVVQFPAHLNPRSVVINGESFTGLSSTDVSTGEIRLRQLLELSAPGDRFDIRIEE